MTDPVRTVLIVSSTRQGRLGPTIAEWVMGEARQREDLDVEVVDLAEAMLPATLTDEPDESVQRFAATIDAADAFVIVVPEYNQGYPASLKQAIDWLYAEWAAKPVALVTYGGISGGLRAGAQLRQVFAEVHAVVVRDTVSFHDAHLGFAADGAPKDLEAVRQATTVLFDRLVWWGRGLRDARTSRPYAA